MAIPRQKKKAPRANEKPSRPPNYSPRISRPDALRYPAARGLR